VRCCESLGAGVGLIVGLVLAPTTWFLLGGSDE
jgi:hypothetical protein